MRISGHTFKTGWSAVGLALLSLPGVALANADVEKNIANSKNWAMQAGDMYNQRYSKLNQINKGNVGKMQVAWTFSTGVLRGHEGAPIVLNNVSVTDNRSYQISADYELLRDLILQAHYAYNKDVFTSTTRIDNVDDFGISGRYLVNRYLSFNVDYAYNERSSSTPNASFTDHTVLIGVRLHV